MRHRVTSSTPEEEMRNGQRQIHSFHRNSNRKSKLETSTTPTKEKSREPSYSQAPVQNKIDRPRQRGYILRARQANSQTAMVDGVWS